MTVSGVIDAQSLQLMEDVSIKKSTVKVDFKIICFDPCQTFLVIRNTYDQ